MALENCVLKGCKFVICCVDNGVERPIGLLTSSTLNSTEDDGATGSYLGGTEVAGQDDAGFVPDPNSMFQAAAQTGDGTVQRWYNLCGASEASCTHELTINGDYCMSRDGAGNPTPDAAQKLVCRANNEFVIKYHDRDTGELVEAFRGEGRTTDKNRNLTGGQDTNANWSATITLDPATVNFLNGMH